MPTPDALSSAPGAGGTVSACAMRIQRQSAGVSSAPITLRDVPLPGTVNGVADDGQARLVERGGDLALRAPLGRAGRGARAGEGEVARERVRGVVGASSEEGEGRGGGASMPRQGTSTAGIEGSTDRRGRLRCGYVAHTATKAATERCVAA